MENKIKAGLTAGALIALVTFSQTIFDSRYALKAEVNESRLNIAVIFERIGQINKKLDEIKVLLTKGVKNERNDY